MKVESKLCYMRLSQLIESLFFNFSDCDELINALGKEHNSSEINEIKSLSDLNLPPIVSKQVLATIIGVNASLIWSLSSKSHRYYRIFKIPKGKEYRTIYAPRVALKIIQKWFSFHLTKFISLPQHVYGFVPGRSHIQAAYQHRNAEWALSVDITDFFSSTPLELVSSSLIDIGYTQSAASLIASLTCYKKFLAQGAPSSPVLSNLCFKNVDQILITLSKKYECNVTRYADDIVFSGRAEMPSSLFTDLENYFLDTPWKLAPHKKLVQPVKGRIKVHGLLVNNENIRLTKGYRNKIRAYKHIISKKDKEINSYKRLLGHIKYEEHVNKTIKILLSQ